MLDVELPKRSQILSGDPHGLELNEEVVLLQWGAPFGPGLLSPFRLSLSLHSSCLQDGDVEGFGFTCESGRRDALGSRCFSLSRSLMRRVALPFAMLCPSLRLSRCHPPHPTTLATHTSNHKSPTVLGLRGDDLSRWSTNEPPWVLNPDNPDNFNRNAGNGSRLDPRVARGLPLGARGTIGARNVEDYGDVPRVNMSRMFQSNATGQGEPGGVRAENETLRIVLNVGKERVQLFANGTTVFDVDRKKHVLDGRLLKDRARGSCFSSAYAVKGTQADCLTLAPEASGQARPLVLSNPVPMNPKHVVTPTYVRLLLSWVKRVGWLCHAMRCGAYAMR